MLDAQLTDGKKDRVASRLRETIESTGVPGAALGVICGGDIWTTCAGALAVDRSDAVTTETRFMLGSVQKVVTAAMTLGLVSNGDVDLDSALIDEFADLEAVDDRLLGVTVRQLLNHSSGIDGDLMVDFDAGPDQLRNYLSVVASLPLLHAPGEAFSYCNAGYSLLGAILERRLAAPFRTLATRAFADLGRGVTISRSAPPNAATGHRQTGGQVEATRDRLPSTLTPAGAETWVCIGDLLALAAPFVIGVTNSPANEMLTSETIAVMQTVTVPLPSHNPLGMTFGLGLFLDDWGGHPVVGHAGGASGYTANLVVLPEDQVAVCFLGNCQGNPAWPAVRDAVFAEFGITPRSVPRPSSDLQLDESMLRPYEGRFARRGQTIDVIGAPNGLRLKRHSTTSHLGPIDQRTSWSCQSLLTPRSSTSMWRTTAATSCTSGSERSPASPKQTHNGRSISRTR